MKRRQESAMNKSKATLAHKITTMPGNDDKGDANANVQEVAIGCNSGGLTTVSKKDTKVMASGKREM
jgi:hypothetical protein